MEVRDLLTTILGLGLLVYSVQSKEPQLTMDQLITNAAKTSAAFDFIQDDRTLLVELDIKYYKEDWKEIEESGLAKTEKRRRRALSRIRRKGIHGNRWTNGVVPYKIARYFNDQDRAQIKKAIDRYHQHTCITFKERTTEGNYISFVDGGGCSSFVGMKGGEQEVTLGRGCRQHGIIMHEVGHAMGFHHEQTRPDRDNYVTIQSNNIPPNVYFNFQKYTRAVIKDWSIPYDYASIMHYGATAFSYNGRPTIIAKQKKFQNVMGNRNGFSFRDVKLLNVMYQCSARCSNKPKCPGEAFVDKSCRCMCPGSPTKPCGSGDTGNYDGAKETKECKDGRETCQVWANKGYCTSRYEAFMTKNCLKSCNLCPTEEPTAQECTDAKENCQYWKEQGHCTSSEWKDYMATNCPKTCGKCSDCVDEKGDQCNTWKSRGFCTYDTYKQFMQANCRKSCDFCPPTTEEIEACKDQKNDCRSWANRGYCKHTYVAYMRTNCPKSCNICSRAAKSCKDNHQKCYVWAYVGECQRNAVWMKANCKKSCNVCEGAMSNPVSDCVDMNNQCAPWAQIGECKKNPAYMHNYCKKSCNRCGAMGDYSGSANCVDSNRFCADWARRGECNRNPMYMHEQCKKSCNKCGGGGGSGQVNDSTGQRTQQQNANCVDRNGNCAYWARTGQCNANPAYMRPNCPRSCNSCGSAVRTYNTVYNTQPRQRTYYYYPYGKK